jgi:O-antigen/teichoic acid export membrane protein
MARVVNPREFGLFALLYALVVLANMIHTAVVVEPLMVLGARLETDSYRQFFATVVSLNDAFAFAAVTLAGTVAFVSMVLGASEVALSSLSVAAAVGGLSYLWLGRRALYAYPRPGQALGLATLHFVGVVTGFGVLVRSGMMSARIALILLGVTAALLGWLSLRIHAPQRVSRGLRSTNAKQFLGEILHYSRWSTPGALLGWASSNVFYVALPSFSGLEQAAVFRAAMNLYLPFQHVLLGLVTLLLAPMAGAALRIGHAPFIRAVFRKGLAVMGAGLAYGIIVFLFRKQLVPLLYGPRYPSVIALAGPALWLPAAYAALSVGVTLLRSVAKPRLVVLAYGCALAIIGAWLVPVSAVRGAGAALLGHGFLQAAAATAGFLFLARAAGSHVNAEETSQKNAEETSQKPVVDTADRTAGAKPRFQDMM